MRKSSGFPAKSTGWRAIIAALLFGSSTISPVLSAVFPTGEITDLAIDGPGFFVVKDSANHTFYRRAGDFVIDNEGYLDAPNGFRVQGLTSDLISPGSIRFIDPVTNHYMLRYEIQADGKVQITLDDSTKNFVGQILLQNLSAPQNGLRFPGDLILQSDAVGVDGPASAPGSNGLGSLLVGNLEIPAPRLQVEGTVGQLSGFNKPLLIPDYVDTDLAVRGRGFFVMRDPNTGEFFATRAGAFYWNPDGYLVNYAGLRVQGTLDGAGTPRDMRVNPDFYEAIIDWWGRLTLYFGNGLLSPAGQILLKDFDHPELLVKARFGCYKFANDSGQWTAYAIPGENGFGQIFASTFDVSQADDDIVEARDRMNFFVQGSLQQTGVDSDCFIAGRGLFIVRDPQSSRRYATRYGAFHLDSGNKIANEQGFLLQGMGSVSTPGDLTVDGNGAEMTAFHIDREGSINVTLANGDSLVRGRILLQEFADPHSLVRETNFLYSNIENALPKFPNGGATPGDNFVGVIYSGAVEMIQLEPGIRIPPPNAVRISVSNFNNGGWVEASADFRTWQRLPYSVFTADTGDFGFLDSNSDSSAPTFYRMVIPTPELPTPLFPLPVLVSTGSTSGIQPLRGLAAELQQR